MEKVRWGLLSTARINAKLIPAINASRRGELNAVASRSIKSAETYAKEWQIPHAFETYQAMLDSDKIDAVYISLPNHLHKEWSIKAMLAGKHVLCEKPFALSMTEVDEMIKVSHNTGRILTEAFMYRHHPQTKITADFVNSGKLGDVSVVRAVFNFLLNNPQDYRLVPDFGGGALWDIGVYPVSYAQMIMGEAPQVVFGSQQLSKNAVDLTFVGELIYSKNRFAQISASFNSPYYAQVEVIGTKGRICSNQPFLITQTGRQLLFYPEGSDEAYEEIPVPEQELYLGEVEDMHLAILDKKPSYLSLAETRNHIRTITALYQSALTKSAVELAQIP